MAQTVSSKRRQTRPSNHSSDDSAQEWDGWQEKEKQDGSITSYGMLPHATLANNSPPAWHLKFPVIPSSGSAKPNQKKRFSISDFPKWKKI